MTTEKLFKEFIDFKKSLPDFLSMASDEMESGVTKLKESGENTISFEIDEENEIRVEIYLSSDGLEVSIEWINSETEEIMEGAVCDYGNDKDIKMVLDYIKRCALDI